MTKLFPTTQCPNCGFWLKRLTKLKCPFRICSALARHIFPFQRSVADASHKPNDPLSNNSDATRANLEIVVKNLKLFVKKRNILRWDRMNKFINPNCHGLENVLFAIGGGLPGPPLEIIEYDQYDLPNLYQCLLELSLAYKTAFRDCWCTAAHLLQHCSSILAQRVHSVKMYV